MMGTVRIISMVIPKGSGLIRTLALQQPSGRLIEAQALVGPVILNRFLQAGTLQKIGLGML